MRASALVALAVMLWQSLHPAGDAGGRSVRAGEVHGGALSEWSRSTTAPREIQLQPSAVPTAVERDWLRALAGAGSRVSWNGNLPSVMVSADPIASPSSGAIISVAAPDAAPVLLRDDVGIIDTLQVQRGGISASVPGSARDFTASVNGAVAAASLEDSLTLRRILVIGTAGWESKFVVAALEEDGWKVDAAIHAAPGADITQGAVAPIDTARYSAVIALDAAAAPYANRIIQFARSGGGVVLEPQAAALEALTSIRVGSIGRPVQAAGVTASAVGRSGLAFVPLTALQSDAVVIDRRGQTPVIAGRRVGAGRVVQLGYDETWRWRMAGGENAVRDHRSWWTDHVSSVAYATATSRPANVADQAPLAALVAAIGPATASPGAASFSASESSLAVLLFTLLAIVLIGEVASRRLRGAG